MNIKQRLRLALLKEGAHKANRFGCVMVFLDVDKKEWKNLQDILEDDDLYLPKDETGYGKENDPHVTILFGLHDDIPDADIEKEINKIKTPTIKFSKISTFELKEYDVLKFDVDSDDLHKLNKKFIEFPHTTDFPDYHPHCTIAYVKKGTGAKYIRKMKDMIDLKIKPSKIVYSKADDTEKSYKLK